MNKQYNNNIDRGMYLRSKQKARDEYKQIMRQKRLNHPDHPIRDAIFAALACFITVALGALFIGIALSYLPAIIIGAILIGVEIISAIVVQIVTIANFT